MKQEVCYVCDYCGSAYGLEADAVDCEFVCRAKEKLSVVSPRMAEALDTMNCAERVKFAEALRGFLEMEV